MPAEHSEGKEALQHGCGEVFLPPVARASRHSRHALVLSFQRAPPTTSPDAQRGVKGIKRCGETDMFFHRFLKHALLLKAEVISNGSV
jgi:hypothetical protein